MGCSNGQAVVLQDDLLKHLRIPHKHVSSLPLCVRAQLYVSGLQLQRMLERSLLRRASHSALLESDKVAVIPVSALRKVESSLEQLCRRPSSKALSSSSSSSAALLLDLQLDSESSLIRHLGEMSLTHRGDDVSRGDDGGGSDVKGKCGLTSAKPALTTASRSGAWRVLGGDAPASALPLPLPLPVSGPGGDKAAVSSALGEEREVSDRPQRPQQGPVSARHHARLPARLGLSLLPELVRKVQPAALLQRPAVVRLVRRQSSRHARSHAHRQAAHLDLRQEVLLRAVFRDALT